MNARYSQRDDIQRIAQDILRSLFPSWLPSSFAWMFAKPFPSVSSIKTMNISFKSFSV